MPRAGSGWCVLALAAMAWGQARPAAIRYASIIGAVLDDATGAPVARAVVKLQTQAAEPSDAVAWTDDRGAFSFSRVPPGRYILSARRDGYEMTRFGTVAREQPPEVLSLASGEERRIALRMRPVGSISGTVSDTDGDPLPGVNVSALTPGYYRRKLHYTTTRAAQADNRGRYRIAGLPAGKYILMANPLGTRPAALPEVVRGQAEEESRFAPQFYPNADRIAAATPVVLAPGRNLEAFDFHLSPQSVSKVAGKVILPSDAGPNAQVTVMVHPEDEAGEGFSGGVGASQADGAFEINDLLPGRYAVTANFSAQGRPYRGVEHVEVEHSPVTVTLRLDPGVELAGSVRLEGDAGGEPPHFRVSLVPGDGLPNYGPAPEAEVKPDGSFRIPNVLPGVWDIGVEPVPQGGYIKSMRLGDQDVLTEDMLIGPETSEPLRIVISTRGAVVDGAVTGAAGEKAKKAYVLLAPAGRRENVWTFYRVVPADENGHFEFKGVTPGAYTLYALARMDSNPSQDPDFLKSLGGLGEAIEVEEGGHVTRELPLILEAETK
jgi:protocatechuate 3,4-dioxygenase beta subunit